MFKLLRPLRMTNETANAPAIDHIELQGVIVLSKKNVPISSITYNYIPTVHTVEKRCFVAISLFYPLNLRI